MDSCVTTRSSSLTSCRIERRGFSLVELLLSIFILAIGIIAISAVFPAGIIQQQQSTDAVIGPIVAQNALGVLRSKLDQEDFGTFEQFGIDLDSHVSTWNPVGSPAPGDWTWIRPSYLLRGGIFTQPIPPNLNPDELHGAIDIFSLRLTRNAESGFDDLPEIAGEPNLGSPGGVNAIFATSDFAVPQDPVGAKLIPDFMQDSGDGYSGAEKLYGIPYNRNKHAILDDYSPDFPGYNGPYLTNPAREGRNEPLVTILQSERSWPQGARTPQYVWDCMFRRYQGRIQVAIFVYRVSSASNEPRPYAVASGYDALLPNVQGFSESPLPVRTFLGDQGSPDQSNVPSQWDWDSFWSPRGLEKEDAANKLDDLFVPDIESGGSVLTALDPFDEGWQSPGQWILDQNGNIHRVLAGRRTANDGPVRLARPVPHVARHASNGNLRGEDGPSTVDEAAAVKAIWFIPPETRDGMNLTPVFVTVRDL